MCSQERSRSFPDSPLQFPLLAEFTGHRPRIRALNEVSAEDRQVPVTGNPPLTKFMPNHPSQNLPPRGLGVRLDRYPRPPLPLGAWLRRSATSSVPRSPHFGKAALPSPTSQSKRGIDVLRFRSAISLGA